MKIRKKIAAPKPSLTSVMDAVFIFIFFLLMSAQFLNIHIFDVQTPTISLVKEDRKKDPLNLTLEITPSEIIVKTGLNGEIKKTLSNQGNQYDLLGLRNLVIELKKLNVEESTISLKPDETVSYENLVKIIDSVRSLKIEEGLIQSIGKNGENIATRTLFDKVVFESSI